MALGSLLGLVGGAIAKAANNYATERKKNTSTPTKTTNTPSYNEHADYINKNYTGGLDAYTKLQNDRYNTALQNNDVDLLNRLQADSKKVGYNLSGPQQTMPQMMMPEMPQTDYSQQMNDLLSAVKAYQSQVPDIPYPDMSDYKFNDIQKQLSGLTNQVQNYQGANYMNMDEAIARANSQLGGMYNEQMNKAIENYNKNAIARGMYGQMPVEALKQNAIAENELNKSNAVNSLGANLYSQDFNMAQQKNNDYYAQINRLADLLGQQYNTELGEYQADLNQYNSMYNRARQADSDYFDNIYRQIDILGTQQNMQQNEMNRYANNIGQFSNDYMAEINRVQGDNDPSNDWQVGYLNNARNQKIAGQNQSQIENAQNQYDQAMKMFNSLGYASGWIADALGIPEGTTTASYSNSLRRSSGSGGSGGTPISQDTNPNLTVPQKLDIWQQATQLASSGKPPIENPDGSYSAYQPNYDEIYSIYLQLATQLGYSPYDLQIDADLERQLEQEMQRRAVSNDFRNGNLPGLGGSIWDLVK